MLVNPNELSQWQQNEFDNPFIDADGVEAVLSEDRLAMIPTFNLHECREGLRAERLQQGVEKALHARIEQLEQETDQEFGLSVQDIAEEHPADVDEVVQSNADLDALDGELVDVEYQGGTEQEDETYRAYLGAEHHSRTVQCLQTCAGDLMGVMLNQLKQMPDLWQKLSQDQQDRVIQEARSAVECAMRDAIEHLNGLGVCKVRGELEQMTFKDGCKVVIKVPFATQDLMELATNVGGSVYIATYDLENAGAGHDGHRGEADQRDLPLGQSAAYTGTGEPPSTATGMTEAAEDFNDVTDDDAAEEETEAEEGSDPEQQEEPDPAAAEGADEEE